MYNKYVFVFVGLSRGQRYIFNLIKKMKKQEIFARTLEIVCEVTEVPAALVMSRCMREEVVDARHIVVKLLSESGLYGSEIAEFTRISGRGVYKILTDFDNRLKIRKPLRINYEQILHQCATKYEATRN